MLRLNGEEIEELADLWQRLWAAGPPGVEVTLTIAREGEAQQVTLRTVDRHAFLKQPRLH